MRISGEDTREFGGSKDIPSATRTPFISSSFDALSLRSDVMISIKIRSLLSLF